MNDKKQVGLTSTVYGHGFGVVNSGASIPIHPAEGIGLPQLGKTFFQLPAACLMIDILGFGRIMLQNKPVEVAANSAVFFKMGLNSISVEGFSEAEIDSLKSNLMRLSDTAALWCYTCESHDNSRTDPKLEERALLWLIKAGQHLLCRGFKNRRYALRGAIAYGDCVQDTQGGAIVGMPWTYASQLEKDQQWAGIAIHSSAVALLTDRHKLPGLLIEGQIPLGSGMQQGWIVDWRQGDVKRADIEATFSLIGGNGERELEKQRNTLAFFGS